jgi:hypothetical protein
MPPRSEPAELSTVAVQGVIYHKGDFVLLRNPKDLHRPFVAIAQRFAQSTGPQKKIVVTTQWYYRPEDMPASLKNERPMKRCVENEIFESSHVDDNPTEALCGKAVVLRVKAIDGWKVRVVRDGGVQCDVTGCRTTPNRGCARTRRSDARGAHPHSITLQQGSHIFPLPSPAFPQPVCVQVLLPDGQQSLLEAYEREGRSAECHGMCAHGYWPIAADRPWWRG